MKSSLISADVIDSTPYVRPQPSLEGHGTPYSVNFVEKK